MPRNQVDPLIFAQTLSLSSFQGIGAPEGAWFLNAL
jgi:hypothetical protein